MSLQACPALIMFGKETLLDLVAAERLDIRHVSLEVVHMVSLHFPIGHCIWKVSTIGAISSCVLNGCLNQPFKRLRFESRLHGCLFSDCSNFILLVTFVTCTYRHTEKARARGREGERAREREREGREGREREIFKIFYSFRSQAKTSQSDARAGNSSHYIFNFACGGHVSLRSFPVIPSNSDRTKLQGSTG